MLRRSSQSPRAPLSLMNVMMTTVLFEAFAAVYRIWVNGRSYREYKLTSVDYRVT